MLEATQRAAENGAWSIRSESSEDRECLILRPTIVQSDFHSIYVALRISAPQAAKRLL